MTNPAALRPPEQVMRLERMGARFQSRLSFMRQVLRRLRDGGVLNRLRVLMLSARMRESDLRLAFELGATDIIRKPFPATIPNALMAVAAASIVQTRPVPT